MARMSPNQKRVFLLTLAGVVIALLGLSWTVFTDLVSVESVEKDAAFTFIFEGAFDQSIPQYEVSHPFVWEEDIPSKARVIINANYAGREMQGPVYVKIQPSNPEQPPIEAGAWKNFATDSGAPVEIPLSFQALYDYSGINSMPRPDFSADQPWKDKEGQFEIYIEYQGKKMAAKTVTVLNTPWFHETYLSDSEIIQGDSITAYITSYNHGAGSEFEVVSCVYRIATPSFAVNLDNISSEPDGWWPEKGLDKACLEYQTASIRLDSGSEKTIAQNIPADLLSEHGIYAVTTWVIKKTPIIEYDAGKPWTDASEIWRMRDGRQYETLIVLQK